MALEQCLASTDARDPLLSDWPVARPPNWPELVDREQPPAELTELREAIARARPLGSEGWATRVMASTGWTVGMRPRGRPRKQKMGWG